MTPEQQKKLDEVTADVNAEIIRMEEQAEALAKDHPQLSALTLEFVDNIKQLMEPGR